MLKTGSEHLLTSAQLICYTKQNYLFLHNTGSAATSSLVSTINRKKKKKNKRCSCTILSHSPPHPTNYFTFHLALFWDSMPKRPPRKETRDRCLSKPTSSKKEKVCGSDSSVVLKQGGGEGCCVCTHVRGGRCCVPKSRGILERAPLLPDGAGAAGWFQFSVLHLLNIRWYPGEEI